MSAMRQPHRLAQADYCICETDAAADDPACPFHGNSPSAKLHQIRQHLAEAVRQIEQLQEQIKS